MHLSEKKVVDLFLENRAIRYNKFCWFYLSRREFSITKILIIYLGDKKRKKICFGEISKEVSGVYNKQIDDFIISMNEKGMTNEQIKEQYKNIFRIDKKTKKPIPEYLSATIVGKVMWKICPLLINIIQVRDKEKNKIFRLVTLSSVGKDSYKKLKEKQNDRTQTTG